MTVVIAATTEAKESHPFTVQRGERVGFKAYGLAGAETVKLQVMNGDDSWSDVIDASGTLTATAYQNTITASGKYRLVKTATAGVAGADID